MSFSVLLLDSTVELSEEVWSGSWPTTVSDFGGLVEEEAAVPMPVLGSGISRTGDEVLAEAEVGEETDDRVWEVVCTAASGGEVIDGATEEAGVVTEERSVDEGEDMAEADVPMTDAAGWLNMLLFCAWEVLSASWLLLFWFPCIQDSSDTCAASLLVLLAAAAAASELPSLSS